MAMVNFRKIDVDALDPDNQVDSFFSPQEPVSLEQIQTLSQQVKQILSKGDYVSALKYALDNPPYGGDENVKNIHLKTIVDILVVVRSSDITQIVEQLDGEEQNVLVKYLYKGMGSPLGQSHGNGGILLTWFEKTVDITGQGPIIRYMSDRRVV